MLLLKWLGLEWQMGKELVFSQGPREEDILVYRLMAAGLIPTRWASAKH